MRRILSAFVAFALAVPVAAQKPIIFDVSNVVVGAQKIQTLYLYAQGKWSDAIKASGSAMLPMRLRPLVKPMLILPPLIFFAGTVKK